MPYRIATLFLHQALRAKDKTYADQEEKQSDTEVKQISHSYLSKNTYSNYFGWLVKPLVYEYRLAPAITIH